MFLVLTGKKTYLFSCCSNQLFQSVQSELLSTYWRAHQRRLKKLSMNVAHLALLSDFSFRIALSSSQRHVFCSPLAFRVMSLATRTGSRSTARSVLKLLLSHSGQHGPVVSYWFSESLITFPHNGSSFIQRQSPDGPFIFLDFCPPLSVCSSLTSLELKQLIRLFMINQLMSNCQLI